MRFTVTIILAVLLVAALPAAGQCTKWVPNPHTGKMDCASWNLKLVAPFAPADADVMTYSAADGAWKPAANPAGFADPMTTRGDLIYRSNAGTTRLPLGAAGQTLSSNGTDVLWQTMFPGCTKADAASPLVCTGGVSTGDGDAAAGLILPETTVGGGTFSFRIYGAEDQAEDGCIVLSGQPSDDKILRATGSTTAIDGKTCRVMAWEDLPVESGGDSVTVGGAAASDPNFSDTTPAAPSMGAITNRGINVKWQKDASAPDNVSAYIPYGGLLLPTMNVRRWGMLAAPGAGSNPTVFGDYIGGNQGAISSLEPDANDGTLMKYRSDATVDSRAGTYGASNWRTGRNIHGMWEGKIGQTSGVRAWVTWSSYTPNGDAFTQGHGAGFRYSSCAEGCANDTNWQCVAYNGTTSIADSGVPPSTTRTQLLEVIYSDDSSPRTLTYRIDGVPVCEFKSDEHHIPNVGQNTKLIFYVWSQDGTAKDIYLAWALTSTDR